MASITINEVSQNYTYNVGNASYATVALPITACWGPGCYDPEAKGILTDEEELESIQWTRFAANQTGLESFVSTFRGPSTHYLQHRDFSYQQALTLLTAGYDVLACRVSTGTKAEGAFTFAGDQSNTFSLPIKAKYAGTFGNKLRIALKKVDRVVRGTSYAYWNMIVYIEDTSGTRTAAENINFVFDLECSTDTILHVAEIQSNYIDLVTSGSANLPTSDTVTLSTTDDDTHKYDKVNLISMLTLTGGTDLPHAESSDSGDAIIAKAEALAKDRYAYALTGSAYTGNNQSEQVDSLAYIVALGQLSSTISADRAKVIYFREWCYNAAYTALDTLDDKLAYNPNRIIVPGWDDQDMCFLADDDTKKFELDVISPLHQKLMSVAYYSRCATAYIDIPRSIKRSNVYNESTENNKVGYAQRLARIEYTSNDFTTNGSYYASHSALFAPWGKYIYTGTSKQAIASPSFLALMIDRAMIKNQTSQYEWQLPTNRKHSLNIGKLDYAITKKYLDEWQSTEGVGINCITSIPDLGTTIWGNSTLYEVPPATYQALANLSTRKLVNAVEDLAYRCGIAITYQYNNDQAYNSFYAGMTPLLDTMQNVGAIEDYYLRMASDINGLDQINANTVVGKIYLIIDGVVNDISVDLIALPPNTDLDQFKA